MFKLAFWQYDLTRPMSCKRIADEWVGYCNLLMLKRYFCCKPPYFSLFCCILYFVPDNTSCFSCCKYLESKFQFGDLNWTKPSFYFHGEMYDNKNQLNFVNVSLSLKKSSLETWANIIIPMLYMNLGFWMFPRYII